MNPGSKLASSLLFGKRRGERHTKLSSTCVLYSNVIIYLACMNYISYSWVAVLIVGVASGQYFLVNTSACVDTCTLIHSFC